MDAVVSMNLNNTLGAWQIGVLVSYVLFGVTTTQTYIYYSRFSADSLKLKALVAFIWVCEVVHELCIGHTLYSYTISNYGHPNNLIPPKSFNVAIVFSGFITICVHVFYSYRVYALSKKLYIPILIWALSLLLLLGCSTIMVTAPHVNSLAGYETQWSWLFTSIWSVSAANDWIITVTLVAFLISQRNYAQKRTMVLVNKLILWTIETGLLMSASGILTLICFVTMKENFIFLAFFAIDAPIFVISLLTSLNSRETLRALNDVSLPISILHLTPTIELPSENAQNTKETQIPDEGRPCHDLCD